MRGGGYASVFRSGARGVVMMFGLELTTKTEGTDSSASPVARRPGAAVERDMSMVCGRASAPGAAHPIARNATRRSKRSVLFAFLVVIPVSRYSIPRRGPAAIDGSKIRRTFDRALCLVVSAVDEGRMRWTRDSRRRTDNRPAIVGIGKRSPSRAARGSCLSTRIFILVPCFRTTSRGGSSPTRSPQAAQQLHLQCTAASCTQLQPW